MYNLSVMENENNYNKHSILEKLGWKIEADEMER